VAELLCAEGGGPPSEALLTPLLGSVRER
jgi:hypothetical protein